MDIVVFSAFLSGFVSIGSICMWLVLPIVLAVSNGKKNRSIGVTLGFIIGFLLITLFVSDVIRGISAETSFFRKAAVGILVLIGLSLLNPELIRSLQRIFSKLISILKTNIQTLQEKEAIATTKTNGLSSFLVNKEVIKPDHKEFLTFLYGFISGLAIGCLWLPCVKPILSRMIVAIELQVVNSDMILLVLFYLAGVALPLFAFSLYGGKLVDKLAGLNQSNTQIQRVFGLAVICIAVGVFYSSDKKVLSDLSNNTYLGLSRIDRIASNEHPAEGHNMFTLKEKIPLHYFAYAGPWFLEQERSIVAKSAASSSLVLHFNAKKVFLVMSPFVEPTESASNTSTDGSIKPVNQATVILDKKIINKEVAGKDVHEGIVNIDSKRIYELVNLKEASSHELIINFSTQGIAVYAFTFDH